MIVEDTGIGINPNDFSKIFEKYGKLHYSSNLNPNSNYKKRIGMSLFLTKEIIKKMKGTISVTSKLNLGSTFRVEFPIQSRNISYNKDEILSSKSILILSVYEEEKRCDFNIPCDSLTPIGINQEMIYRNIISNCNCPKILIVDDEVNNRFVLCSFCKKAEILFDEANEGIEACDKVFSFSRKYECCKTYRLILMDSNMPVMNGEDASLNIRNFYDKLGSPPPQIYFVTANSDQNEVIKRRKEFIYDKILNKPVSHEVFKNDIAQIMNFK